MTIKTLLAIDPGTNSFAYSIQRLTPAGQPKLLRRGFIHSTVRTLTNSRLLRAETTAFSSAIRSILDQFNVDAIILERYMLRRGSGGTAIECINLMIGILLTLDLPLKCIPASQWKNAVNRTHLVLDDLYPIAKDVGITPHELDAALIGQWGWNFLLQQAQTFRDPTSELTSADAVNIGEKFKKLNPKRKRPKAKR